MNIIFVIIASAIGGLLAAAAIAVATLIVGMRRKSTAVLGVVRRFNRRVTNPRQLRSAGTPGAYASIIRHVGRVSGASYETPIGVHPADGWFLIALPYGPNADWVRNLMNAGSAELVSEGRTYHVDQPNVVATDSVQSDLPPGERRQLRLFGVDQVLRLRATEHPA